MYSTDRALHWPHPSLVEIGKNGSPTLHTRFHFLQRKLEKFPDREIYAVRYVRSSSVYLWWGACAEICR